VEWAYNWAQVCYQRERIAHQERELARLAEELGFWRDLGRNLLTRSQLDTRMPNSGRTAREVLAASEAVEKRKR